MQIMEVIGISIHAPAYMPTPQGVSVPCVALEIGGRTPEGGDTAIRYCLSPDLVEKLLPRLIHALEQVQAIPSASSGETH